MPQMMPINWMMLFIFFIITFIIFIMMNYYIFNVKLLKNKKNNKIYQIKNFNWKW